MAFFPGPESACLAAIVRESLAANRQDLAALGRVAAEQTPLVGFQVERAGDLPLPPVDCGFLNSVLPLRSVSAFRLVGAMPTALRKVQARQSEQQKLAPVVW